MGCPSAGRCRRRAIHRACLGLFFLLLGTVGRIMAETNAPITVEIITPFHTPTVEKRTYWPISVRIARPTKPMTLQVTLFASPLEQFRQTAFLGTEGEKLLSFEIPLLPETTAIHAAVRNDENGEILWQGTTPLPEPRVWTIPVVSGTPFAVTEDQQCCGLGQGAPSPTILRVIDVRYLPVLSRAYDSTRWLVVHGLPDLSDRQERALVRWVRDGGSLIVFTGREWQGHEGPLDDVLPFHDAHAGTFSFDGTNWQTFHQRFLSHECYRPWRAPRRDKKNAAVPGLPDRPLQVWGGLLHGDASVPFLLTGLPDPVIQGRYTPLLAARSVGRGHVVALAFNLADPPLDTPALRTEILMNVLRVTYRTLAPHQAQDVPPPSPGPVLETTVLDLATEFRSVRVPTLRFIVLWLVVYWVCVGPLDFLISRRLRRWAIPWVTFPAIALAFTVVAYVWAYHYKGQNALLSQWTLVRVGPPECQSEAQTFMALFSPTRRAYDVEVPSEEVELDMRSPRAELVERVRGTARRRGEARAGTMVGRPRTERVDRPRRPSPFDEHEDESADPDRGVERRRDRPVRPASVAESERVRRRRDMGDDIAASLHRDSPLILERVPEGTLVREWPAFQWGVRMLRACWTLEGPAVQGTLGVNGDRIYIRIQNHLPLDLIDVLVLTSASAARLGPVPAGRTTERNLSWDDFHGPLARSGDLLFPNVLGEDAFLRQLFEGCARSRGFGVRTWEGPLILACAQGAILPISVRNALVTQQSRFTVMEAPCQLVLPNFPARIPAGICAKRIVPAVPAREGRSDSPILGRRYTRPEDAARDRKVSGGEIIEFQVPPSVRGTDASALRIHCRFHLKTPPGILGTDIMLGVDYLERGSVRIQIWNHRDGRWEVIQRKPRWAGPAGTPSPVRFEKQTFPNTREGLQSLMGVLRQRSSLPSRDHPAKSDEAQEGLESIAERQTTRPGPVLELLSKDEIEGPAEIENLTPLLSQFHCLPMRAGPYTATAFWNERGQWLDPEGRLYLALFFTSAVDLQHLEVEVFPRTSLEPPIPGVEELIRPQEEKESP